MEQLRRAKTVSEVGGIRADWMSVMRKSWWGWRMEQVDMAGS